MTPDNERRADELMELDPFEAAALRQRRAVIRQPRAVPPSGSSGQETLADIWEQPTPFGLVDIVKGIAAGVRGAGRAVSGAYAVQPEIPGQWSEADEFRGQHARQQMRSDASALAGAVTLGSLPRVAFGNAAGPAILGAGPTGRPRGERSGAVQWDSGVVNRTRSALPMDEASRMARA